MIYVLVLVFTLGVWTGTIYGLSFLIYPLLSILLGFFLLSFRNKRVFGSAFLIILCFSLGMVRVESVDRYSPEDLSFIKDRYVKIEGEIVSAPEERETRERVILGSLTINGLEYPDFKILVWTDLGKDIGLFDRVSTAGFLSVPEDFETDSGRVFDYRNYLSKDDIYLELEPTFFEAIEFEGFSIRRSLYDLKSFFVKRIQNVLPEPGSSLAGGILLGEKQSLGSLWQDRFQTVGLTHIIVLSGYNISIVIGVVLFLLSSLSITLASMISIIGIILFAILVGGGATVVRASVMASLLILARFLGRPYDAIRALFLAGAIMIFINPRILVYDLSFQLSFLATLGIILFVPRAERMFSFVPEKLGLREIVATTFAAQLYVLPWIAYTIGNFSVVSFLSNILVLPTVPLAMLFSFIAGVFSVKVIAFPAYVLLSYELWIAEVLSKVPAASINIPTFPIWLIILLYLGIAYVTFSKRFSATSKFMFEKKSST